ncbi:MAG TPA: cytochrome c3 family protein [Pontiella sp.]|nr:cytochrome c3 family protein [Pontiella sp.]
MSLFVGPVLLLTGCEEEEYQLKFSHHLHVMENEMDCTDCHGEAGEVALTPITHETCAVCHDEAAAEEVRKDTCGYCHQEKLLPKLENWTAETKPAPRNIFVHTDALADRCVECHESIINEDLVTTPKLQRDDIVQIRDAAHASGEDCLTCHVDMDRYQAPASHDLAWMQRHGPMGIQTDAACGVCHSEDSCRECHSIMQPVSHNNLWRLRTHGMEAAWDRARCMVCHEEDSCTSCHSQVKPQSHGVPLWVERHGTWEPGRCMVCHEPDYCNACHATTPPRSHRTGLWDETHGRMNDLDSCYTCHEPDYCNSCHATTPPRSHQLNWDDRHCSVCHLEDGESCVVCHEGGNNKVELHEDAWPGSHDGFSNQTDCLRCH